VVVAKMSETLMNSTKKPNRNSSDSKPSPVPILKKESEQGFKDRLREVIADRKLTWFAKECGFSDSLLGAYLRGEKLPGLDNLVSMANLGNVTVDWLATGRQPKTRAELRVGAAPVHPDAERHETYRLAVEVAQEWQVEHGKFLPADKFMQAVELLVELSEGEPDQVRKKSAQVLRLAA
jgi:transcriptional regulator with XRE-family HTH domain